MTKCAILLFYATIAGSFCGSLAESPGNFSKFEPIGSSSYYIESEIMATWYEANSTCARLGSHLANTPKTEELLLIMDKLPEGIRGYGYWLNINKKRHTVKGLAPFLKWENNPVYGWNGFLAVGEMVTGTMHFICEAENIN